VALGVNLAPNVGIKENLVPIGVELDSKLSKLIDLHHYVLRYQTETKRVCLCTPAGGRSVVPASSAASTSNIQI
jgi:hypothetical protein